MGEDYYGGDADESIPTKKMNTGLLVLLLLGGLCGLSMPCIIIGAIAVPNLIEARKHGNEASAIGSLRVINSAEAIYRETHSDGDQSLKYGDLQALGQARLIDQVLASGLKQGYEFEWGPGQDLSFDYWVKASPVEQGTTGDRYFFTNQTGVIYYSLQDFDYDPSMALPPCLKPIGQ